jgi:hypothetical protein
MWQGYWGEFAKEKVALHWLAPVIVALDVVGESIVFSYSAHIGPKLPRCGTRNCDSLYDTRSISLHCGA